MNVIGYDVRRFVRAHRAYVLSSGSTAFVGAGPIPGGVVITRIRMITAVSSTVLINMALRLGEEEALNGTNFITGSSLLGRGGVITGAFGQPAMRFKAFSGISSRLDFSPYVAVISGPVWVNLALKADAAVTVDGDIEVVAERVERSVSVPQVVIEQDDDELA